MTLVLTYPLRGGDLLCRPLDGRPLARLTNVGFGLKELQVRPSGEEWRAEEGDMYTGGTLPHAAPGEVSLTTQRDYSDG